MRGILVNEEVKIIENILFKLFYQLLFYKMLKEPHHNSLCCILSNTVVFECTRVGGEGEGGGVNGFINQ